MICFQLCNYTWPQFVLLCDEGIGEVRLFLISPGERGWET